MEAVERSDMTFLPKSSRVITLGNPSRTKDSGRPSVMRSWREAVGRPQAWMSLS